MADFQREKAELQGKLDVLKANREKVSIELLTTKYATAYNRLLKDIKVAAWHLFEAELLYKSVKKTAQEEVIEEMQKRWELFLNKIMNDLDIDGAVDIIEEYIFQQFMLGNILIGCEPEETIAS